jgi:cytochrome c oxidase subunit 4|tara:strand:+ start:267 stop:584 length:318 start_codon:yes stop_codon:yes gene_type:complete
MADSGSTRQIWIVFWILFFLTTVEVLLGIFKPAFMLENAVIGVSLLNHTFIILTIIKAYYIVATFMHLGHEKKSLQISIVAPMWVLIPYLLFILLCEASFHGAIG